MLYLDAAHTIVSTRVAFHSALITSPCVGWDHDEVHAVVWKRDVGQEKRMETTWKNERAWCEWVCVWKHACAIHPVSPPLPIVSSCGRDTLRFPPQWLERRGLDWDPVRLPAEWLSHLEVEDIALGPVRDHWPVKDQHALILQSCSTPAKSYLSTSRTFFLFSHQDRPFFL